MPTKSTRTVRWRRCAGVLALSPTLVALAGCALLGGPQPLDAEQLESISARVSEAQPGFDATLSAESKTCEGLCQRVSEAQPGFDATLSAESKTCEGLCQRVSVDLSPKIQNYSALDVARAIYETDLALEERQISAFEYCFEWRSWETAEVQYLDARLGEVRGLGYNGVLRDAENQRPMYDCYSFASISGGEQLAEFLGENGSSEG